MAYLYTAYRNVGTYGKHAGYVTYSTSTSATAVTVTISDVGEHWTHTASGTYSGSASGTTTVTAQLTTGGGTQYFSTSGSKSSIGSVSIAHGATKYISFSPTSKSQTISRTSSAQSVVVKISWTWNGTTTSNSMVITIPALETRYIYYNANGGSGAPATQSFTYGQSTAVHLSTTIPTRTGYDFLGWSLSDSATTASYQPGQQWSTNNNTYILYAVWKLKTYTITYDANGGTGGPTSGTKSHGVAYTIPSSKPTRTNYTFTGWLGSNSVTYQPSGTIAANVNQALTLTAQWQINYVKPTITNIVAVRADSSGTAADEGTYMNLSFTYTTDTALTATSIVVQGKTKSATTYTDIFSITSGLLQTDTISRTALTLNGTQFALTGSYDIQIIITDSNSQTVTVNTYLSLAFFTIDFLAGGHGVAIGKPSTTTDLFDVGMDTSFDGTVTLSADPTNNLEAATKQYVDSAESSANTYTDNHKPYMHASTQITALNTTNGTWIAPYDGFFVSIWRANAAGAYVGIRDETASRYVLMMSQPNNGSYFSGCFPVRKGNTYKAINISNAGNQATHVYYFRSDSDDN